MRGNPKAFSKFFSEISHQSARSVAKTTFKGAGLIFELKLQAALAKSKTVFVCSNCGNSTPQWLGKCPHCEAWNTLQEEVVWKEPAKGGRARPGAPRNKRRAVPLPEIRTGRVQRLETPDPEWNRVLGGGVVPGSVILLGGEPGIGKSTLALQLALQTAVKVLYVSGEESEEQIKMRAERLTGEGRDCYIFTETHLTEVLAQAEKLQPQWLLVDSVQTMVSPHLDSTPGSISQVRECAGELQRFAKESGVPVLLIGHITKEGVLAGPKLLEHIVDVVLQFEGERHHSYRILRTLKNRFGSTDELGIYEMTGAGLRVVSNPSELLISQTEEALSGSAVAATMEGLRPLLIETQALVAPAVFGTPQRSATGFDLRRMNMLLAVLEKRGGFPFGQCDVFLNMAGGIRATDPATDLAVVSALLSSLKDAPLPHDCCFAGEVGLSGEIRAVNRIEQRIQEADRLGFRRIFIPRFNRKGLPKERFDIQITPLGKLDELYAHLF